MKRDMDLVREILLFLQNDNEYCKGERYNHSLICIDGCNDSISFIAEHIKNKSKL